MTWFSSIGDKDTMKLAHLLAAAVVVGGSLAHGQSLSVPERVIGKAMGKDARAIVERVLEEQGFL
jgi:hypothetical protein